MISDQTTEASVLEKETLNLGGFINSNPIVEDVQPNLPLPAQQVATNLHDKRKNLQMAINTVDYFLTIVKRGQPELTLAKRELQRSRMMLGKLLRIFGEKNPYEFSSSPCDMTDEAMVFDKSLTVPEEIKTLRNFMEHLSEELLVLLLTAMHPMGYLERYKFETFCRTSYVRLIESKLWLGMAYAEVKKP